MKVLTKTGTWLVSKVFPFRVLRSWCGNIPVFPFYHLVSDQRVEHVVHLYRYKSVSQFRNDLDFLLKQYIPVSLAQVLDYYEKGTALPANSFLLSFDDGLKEFKDIIAPELIKKGIPAINFVNSAFIDNKDLFYRYKASILVESALKSTENQSRLNNFFSDMGMAFGYKNALLSVDYQNRHMLDEAADLIELSFQNYLKDKKPYLSSEDIISLSRQGFSFGAHSIDHPLYRNISVEEQVRQTTESINFLKKLLPDNPGTFAFPYNDNGVRFSFYNNPEVKETIQVSFGTEGLIKDTVANNIQRIPFENRELSASSILSTEYSRFISRTILKRNIFERK